MIICSAVQIQYWSVTDIRKMDGRTDRQTDRIAMSIARLSTAVLTHDKKDVFWTWSKEERGLTGREIILAIFPGSGQVILQVVDKRHKKVSYR